MNKIKDTTWNVIRNTTENAAWIATEYDTWDTSNNVTHNATWRASFNVTHAIEYTIYQVINNE